MQLQSAEGMVRCGACLQVFCAEDNLVPCTELQTTPDSDDIQPHDDDDIQILDLADAIPGRATPSISAHSLDDILYEVPLEAEDYHHSYHEAAATPVQRSPVLWPYAALLLLALLAQFVIREFDTLSANPNTRHWLQRGCDLIGCQLPPMVDIAAIRSENLQVGSHADYSNALSIDMTMRNGSIYAQPFPLLSLKFSSADDEVVASRNFTPEEYLPPDYGGNLLLEADAAIQIHLDILDPGSEAVNYQISFSPYQSP